MGAPESCYTMLCFCVCCCCSLYLCIIAAILTLYQVHSGDCKEKLGRVEMVNLGELGFFKIQHDDCYVRAEMIHKPEKDTAMQAILISAFLHFSCFSADVLTDKGRSDTRGSKWPCY